ncbi:MAG: hypothetical protein RLZZ292_373 [Bacteroidota bacterium]|jgi:hypothetical protein
MKNLFLSLFVAFVAFTTTQCNKETTIAKPISTECETESIANTSSVAMQNLVGTWVWVKTQGGRLAPSEPYETAQSTGKTRKLVITADKKLSLYEDGKLTYSTTFELEEKEGQVIATQVYIADAPDYFSGLLMVCDQHLRTGKSYVDGFDFYYDKE